MERAGEGVGVFLTAADVERLTGKVRFSAQRRALDALGIRYIKAATGEPLVREADLGKEAAGKGRGPKWDRIAA